MNPDQIGGRYKVIERLGKGAMGVVFKAHDPVLDRLVAVKKMVDEIGEDEELRRRFQAEARAAARLNHANIVTIYELGEAGTEAFIVMELLEGVDLATVIRRKIPLTVPARLSIVAQLCEGLEFAHEHGIVHRDIKPANLHLSPAGVVKILDFGIARLVSSTMTNTGALLGTPDYMSPEQVNGARIDTRSDLFAVGAVFYELMCGGRPFEGPSVPVVLMKIASEPHVPVRERAPDVAEPIADLIDRLMAKDPGARPASARVVADEIRAMQGTDAHTMTAAGTEIGAMVAEQTLVPRTPLPVTPRPAGRAREAPISRVAEPAAAPPRAEPRQTATRMRMPLVAGVAAGVLMMAGVAGSYGLVRRAPGTPVAVPGAPVAPTVPVVPLAAANEPPKERPAAAAPEVETPAMPMQAPAAPAGSDERGTIPPAGRRSPAPSASGDARDTTTRTEAPTVVSSEPAPPRQALAPGTLETLTGKRSAQGLEMFDSAPMALASVARIRDVLDQYAQAMERQDAETVARLRLGLSPFEQRLLGPGARITSYQFSSMNIAANGLAGAATGIRDLKATLDTGESLAQSAAVTIRLVRRPGGWIIADIR